MPVFVILRQRTLVITFKSIVCTPDSFFCGFLPSEQDVWSSGVGRGALWPARISIAVEKTAGANSPDFLFIYLFILEISLHTNREAGFLKTTFCVDVGWFIRHLVEGNLGCFFCFFFSDCQFLHCVFSGGPLDWLDYKDLWRCWVVKKINYVEFSQLWRLCPSYALHKGKKTSHGNELGGKKTIYLFS